MNAPFVAPGPSLAPEAEPAADPARRSGTPLHDARALTGGGAQARILLGDSVYVLRITRLGKLILTK